MNKNNIIKTIVLGTVLSISSLVAAEMEVTFEDAVKECDSCHGKNGNSEASHIPTIAGISEYYFLDTMSSFKKGERPASTQSRDGFPDTDMQECADKLTEDMTKQLASYYAKQAFIPVIQEFTPELAKTGKKHFKKYCEKCHEDSGRSKDDDAGILAGQHGQYLKDTLEQIVSGEREVGKKMKKKLDRLIKKSGPESIDALLHFFASQQK
ncbi:MAG: hypothetical protein KUG78_11960 [Kangiellaceae bacterium]|nr:hypothetical protein [Kangiellaceae bacterium]